MFLNLFAKGNFIMDATFIVQNFKFTCQICKLNNTIVQKNFIVRIRKLRQHSCVYKETYEDNHEIKMNKLSDINNVDNKMGRQAFKFFLKNLFE